MNLSHPVRPLTTLSGLAAILAGSLLIPGCPDDRPELRGGRCEVNSDCDRSLVCRLARCRKECVDHRDCGLGLDCLVGEDGLKGCQLDDELDCQLDSECTDVLVCRGGQCVNECAVDLDCPPLATCAEGEITNEAGEPETVRWCEVPEEEAAPCVYNSDCGPPLICDDDQRCRPECEADRDCIAPRVCVGMRCVLGDGGA